MASYLSDRAFTDFVHKNLATPTVYNKIGWKEQNVGRFELEKLDIHHGIDYVFQDSDGNIRTVQERFRESKYANFSDFTIRYRRDLNPHSDRVQSEYYKINADYFTYGITNGTKNNIAECTQFLKIAIIDLKKVYEKINSGEIIISDNGRNICRITNGKIECPIKYNSDGSSSFFPIEISFLIQLWGKDMVIFSKGF